MSGLIADARTLVEHARVETQSRPFGVSLLIAGHDENGPSLFTIESYCSSLCIFIIITYMSVFHDAHFMEMRNRKNTWNTTRLPKSRRGLQQTSPQSKADDQGTWRLKRVSTFRQNFEDEDEGGSSNS
ncbi:hypothetical protein QVD17_24898 [Tagetes erecta]|uniref:Uncharacterized protein n=1 Tax=Tagetes erecta TaxID=13708 RepID=A0AAD8KIJ3_TARER|nr:hypothetical protein QVD17_24898 [Tagetes erecta]